jgi:alanine-synthesizing transaminase
MVLSGAVKRAVDYRHALDLLAALRLCSNVAGQWAVAPALEGADTIAALTAPGGRLYETRSALIQGVGASEFLSLTAPDGALYAFPRIGSERLPQFDDDRFAHQLLERERVLVVPGSSFNVPYRDHLRLTLLPEAAVMREVLGRIERELGRCAEDALAACQVA